MFWVWNAAGVQTPYVPGALERRRVARVRAPDAIRPANGAAPELPSHGPPLRPAAVAGYRQGERERRRAVAAADLMSAPVVTLPPEASLDDAWEMVHARGFRHVPIVGPSGALAGILSDRDLLRAALARRTGGAPVPASVRDVMATRVLTARPEARVREVARVLVEERIGAMPIVDDAGRVVGILTRSDVLRAVVGSAPLELWI